MKRRVTVQGGTVLAGAVVLASCATGTGSGDTEDRDAGMGVPRQAVEEFSGTPRTVQARVHVAGNGCFLGSLVGAGSRYLVVWPPDTELGSSGDELELVDGTTVRDGDVLAGAGMLAPTRELEGFGSDGYWDHAVGYCTPRASQVLVLDPGATVQSPTLDAEERALVRRAVRRLARFEALDRRVLARREGHRGGPGPLRAVAA